MDGLSASFRDSVLPFVILLAIYGICGFIGNIIVLYVYTFRYTKNRFRCLVIAMGLVDLTSCLTTIPLEAISTWLWLNFPSTELCKMKSFFIQFTENSAIYILFVTAVYKYRQICKPLSTQSTTRSIMVSCAIGIIFAAVLAAPSAVLWDINTHNLTFNNSSEIVAICEVYKDFHDTIYPTVYTVVLSGYTLFPLATMVLYIFVARTTIQHYQRLQRHQRPASVAENPVYTVELIGESQNKQDKPSIQQAIVETTLLSHSAPTDCHSNNRKSEQTQCDALKTLRKTSLSRSNIPETPSTSRVDAFIRKLSSSTIKSTTNRRASVSQLTPSRIRKVAIMVILAGTFSVTFFLALGLGYVFAIRDFDEYESLRFLVIYFCMYRFYFINYCLNPVVYFVLDGQFRKGVKELFACQCAERSK